MTILYIDTLTHKAEVIDSITEKSVILFKLSDDDLKTISTLKDIEGIHFGTIPIGIFNNMNIFITVNNMDGLLSILMYDIITRKEIKKINILYENIYIN